ncbi:MAG: hypothetical protein K2J95_00795 [Lachnospiraceae bacterium]|nr:hypothetical protein [Lachnospiraceae bacterium]
MKVVNENNLNIAEIPYKTGEIHIRYSCKLSDDGTRWIHDGLSTEYYRSGNIASTGFWVDGLENGHFKEYHENGQLAAEGDYADGKKIGKWSFYDKNGNKLDYEG